MRFAVAQRPLLPLGRGAHAQITSLMLHGDERTAAAALLPTTTTHLFALNDGQSTRPVSDLFENPASVAYLGVLTVLVGFLGYLALADRRAKQRRSDGIQEMRDIAERMRTEGDDGEAEILEREARLLERKAKSSIERLTDGESEGLAALLPKPRPPPPDPAEAGNRFMRRQVAELDQEEKPTRKSRRRPARRRGSASRKR